MRMNADTKIIDADYLNRANEGARQHRQADAVLTFKDAHGKPLAGVPVEICQTQHAFLFGNCATFDLCDQGPVHLNPLPPPVHNQPLWEERFLNLFNLAILPFYWSSYEPTQGNPRHDSIEGALAWCKQHGVTAKGHPLMWPHHPDGMAEWLRPAKQEETDMLTGEKRELKRADAGFDAAQTQQFQLGRISREVNQFKGRIAVWDVYNEAAWCKRAEAPKLADAIDAAFRVAHEADPAAHLILNDAGMYVDSNRRDGFYHLILELQKRGTPLGALGFQSHIGKAEWWSPEQVVTTLDHFAALGYPIHITEFMPTSDGEPMNGIWRTGNWTPEAQAEFAEQFYRIWFGHPAVASITWWGLTDRHIWLPQGGLIDEDYNPKPVYARLDALINQEWKTKLTVTTDAQGQVRFRGFLGDYALSAAFPGAEKANWQASLSKQASNTFTFATTA